MSIFASSFDLRNREIKAYIIFDIYYSLCGRKHAEKAVQRITNAATQQYSDRQWLQLSTIENRGYL